MANSNQVGLAIWEESAFGTLPVGEDLKAVRFRSESLAKSTASTISQEIRSDRQIADMIRTGIGAGGSIDYELSYGSSGGTSSAFDMLLEASLGSDDWTAVVTNTGSWSTSGSNIVGTNVSIGIDVGRWVRLKDDATVLGYHLVTAVPDANTLTVTPAPSSLTGTGDEEVEAGGFIKNGTTERSFSIERSHSDLSNVFEQYAGMTVNGVSLSVATGAIAGGSFSFLGKTETSATATMGDGGNTAHVSNSVMNAVDHISALRENHTSLGTVVQSIAFDLTNNLYPRNAVGTLGATDIGVGSINVSGSLVVYFANNTTLDKYRDWTTTSLTAVFQDSSGNAYCIHLPAVKLSAGTATAAGLNQDVFANFAFQAFRDSTLNETIRITRWDA
jgi:hypothetical protein